MNLQIAQWVKRSLLVSVAYLAGLMLIGGMLTVLGAQLSQSSQTAAQLPGLLIGSLITALALGPIASQLPADRTRHLLIWACVIFFNTVSVVIEGAFFAPTQIGNNLSVLVIQQFLLAAVLAGAVTILFAPKTTEAISLPARTWLVWLKRLIGSAASYVVFYFFFGGINYMLVTKPYYETHVRGLSVPSVNIVLIAEIVRGLLIVLSVLPFLLTVSLPPRTRAFWTGTLLFVIGGIVPLLYQINTLPLPLLIASGVEIFFQNFSTGIVAALLLGRMASRWTPQMKTR